MNFKKRVNGSWADIPHYIHNTSTDTLTTLPAVIYPNASSITVGIKGQSSQSGTPSPQSPVDVNGTGERTGNLLNPSDILYNMQFDTSSNPPAFVPSDTLNCSNYIPVTVSTYLRTLNNVAIGNWYFELDANKNFLRTKSPGEGAPMVISNDASYIVFNISKTVDINKYMFARTSTPLPYEPYGYKIPISCGGTTTPVYLGEVQSTRQIQKLVLTGEESWTNNSNNACCVLYINPIGSFREYNPLIRCSHVPMASTQGNLYNRQVDYGITFGGSSADRICIRNKDCEPVADFKNWLRQQYSAGTPVTVWYVLANEETSVVNEPLMKIGDYADSLSTTIPCAAGETTLDVQTTVQPSEVSAGFSGWHPVSGVHERENGQWD